MEAYGTSPDGKHLQAGGSGEVAPLSSAQLGGGHLPGPSTSGDTAAGLPPLPPPFPYNQPPLGVQQPAWHPASTWHPAMSSLYSSLNREASQPAGDGGYSFATNPALVSPYATLALNPASALPPVQAHMLSPPPGGTLSPGDGAGTLSPPQQARLTQELDNYSLALIRGQMEQAQQQAQVACCQVQLLRDQLSAETTARLEAQARTNSLLSANKELLDQVQNLVNRMQHIETRIVIGDAQPQQQAFIPQPTLYHVRQSYHYFCLSKCCLSQREAWGERRKSGPQVTSQLGAINQPRCLLSARLLSHFLCDGGGALMLQEKKMALERPCK